MFRNLKIRLLKICLYVLSLFNPPTVWALKAAIQEIGRLEEKVRKLTADIARLDRTAALDVRSSLELLNFENMGEIIWIKVSDDRMLRHDVFNQIRDWMASHGRAHSILIVTGTNVKFEALTDQDLVQARLRRMTQEECGRNLVS
jgi:hypothetical protein